MASKQCEAEKQNFKLEEHDIPGAILPREIPEECNVVQLKRWLLCRGASTSGNKKQLVARFVFFFFCAIKSAGDSIVVLENLKIILIHVFLFLESKIT